MEPISRRTLLIGGGAAAALAAAGALAWDEDSHLWWRAPGTGRPRREGEVDQPGVRWVPASEANWRRADRPEDFPIDRVVIHVTQASFATTLEVFRDPLHKAASHYVVPAHGGRVVQMVREMDVAFHAGNLEYNNTSVGIEHEGFIDRPQDFTTSLYRTSARVTAAVCKRYSIPVDRRHVIGHSQVPGTDHTDPGPHWDWERYMHYVRQARGALG
jgi:N-acetyl-anhydromuramyl-L-alanine amidase AmpD